MDPSLHTKKRRKRGAGLLVPMLIALLLVAGFQVYWVKDNYKRSRAALELRTSLLFRDMMRNLQDSVISLRVSEARHDTAAAVMADTGTSVEVPATARAKAKETIRIRSLNREGDENRGLLTIVRLAGSADTAFKRNDTNFVFRTSDRIHPISNKIIGGRGFMDSLDPESIQSVRITKARDSSGSQGLKADQGSIIEIVTKRKPLAKKQKPVRREKPVQRLTFSSITLNDGGGQRIVIQLDSLLKKKIPDSTIRRSFITVLDRERINVPFAITEKTAAKAEGPDADPRASEGLYQPYQLKIGNSFPYLLRQMMWPIVFSIFLVALTIFSFIILYRSLLKQYRLSQIKNDLISNITHELKTPIATVGVAIEALKNFNAINDSKRTEEYLDISRQELQRLGLLVDKVLKLSMFENEQIRLTREAVNMQDLITEVTGSLRLQLEKQLARVEFMMDGDLWIRADRLHLLSVIFNLLDNALKYSVEEPVIMISAKGTPSGVEFRVSDNGIGIPTQYQGKVFDKFFRVPYGDTHNAKGHGLGLSYVSEVVRLHGGSIRVESVEHKGSSFIINLPKDN